MLGGIHTKRCRSLVLTHVYQCRQDSLVSADEED